MNINEFSKIIDFKKRFVLAFLPYHRDIWIKRLWNFFKNPQISVREFKHFIENKLINKLIRTPSLLCPTSTTQWMYCLRKLLAAKQCQFLSLFRSQRRWCVRVEILVAFYCYLYLCCCYFDPILMIITGPDSENYPSLDVNL